MMDAPRRIYLDNAATSWPKPERVYAAVDRYQRECGAPHGRGAYRESIEVAVSISEARRSAARLINAESADRVIFTFNGTDSLNLAIHGILQPGDIAVTTAAEHNSVLRPLAALEREGQVRIERVGCDSRGVIDLDQLAAAVRTSPRLVVMTHASNVTGALQPVEEAARLSHERGAVFLLDAAQTVGHFPTDVRAIGADLVAAGGHKGLLGPLGTGILYIRPGFEREIKCVRQGGTGTDSFQDWQPDELPARYESGNLNVPGLMGLGAALQWIEERGVRQIRRHACELTAALLDGLRSLPGVTVHGPAGPDERVGVTSISQTGFDPQELAIALDSGRRIQVRAGLHCAPRMHEALGTLGQGGTVRFSVGPMNDFHDVNAAIEAMAEITEAPAR
jgi:cysteine desulfurase family protein